MSWTKLGRWMLAAALTAGAVGLGSAAAFAASGSAGTAGASNAGPPARGELANIAGYLKLKPATLLADLKAGQSLEQIASAQNVSTATLTADIEADMKTRLDKLVSMGKLTQAQATARETRFDARLPALLSQSGFHPMDWGRGGLRAGAGPRLRLLAETARLLNLTTRQLMTDLRGGQTVAQVAQEHNVNVQTLTQELESWVQQRVDTQVSNFVNGTRPHRSPGSGA